jgi:hypothetical protein
VVVRSLLEATRQILRREEVIADRLTIDTAHA